MARVLTASQIRAADARTIQSGLSELVLMENAARECVSAALEFAPELSRIQNIVLCGKGNNGGKMKLCREIW